MNVITEFLKRTRQELDEDGLERFCTGFDGKYDVTAATIAKYEVTLDAAKDERPLQRFLADHPALVVAERMAGCRWVIPQKRLGSEFVPDFVVARLDSNGVTWTLLELQSPNDHLFNPSNRRATAQLNEGLEQIRQWRGWLKDNLPYARNPRSSNGLGLRGINPASRGLVVIGRETARTAEIRAKIQEIQFERQIDIHSYDWLAREARNRISFRQINHDEGCDTCYLDQPAE
jgi:hypothetical protein